MRARGKHWEKVEAKRMVRERDGNRCAECLMTNTAHKKRYGKSLQVHRIIPGGEYTLENCTLLCCDCHRKKPKKVYTVLTAGRFENTMSISVKMTCSVEKYDGYRDVLHRFNTENTGNGDRALEVFAEAIRLWYSRTQVD